MAGLIAISLCLTVTILELLKLKREAQEEAVQKEEAAKGLDRPSFRHSHSHQVRGQTLPLCITQPGAQVNAEQRPLKDQKAAGGL